MHHAVQLVAADTGPFGFTSGSSFTFRIIALYRGWEEPLAREPAGAYRHSDRRPLLGRKLAGKSSVIHPAGVMPASLWIPSLPMTAQNHRTQGERMSDNGSGYDVIVIGSRTGTGTTRSTH